MKSAVRILVTVAASIGIAALLSAVPRLESRARDQWPDKTAFHAQRLIQVDNETLVDAVVRLPLRLDLKRLDWDGSVLSMDLMWNLNVADPKPVFQDLIRITSFGFGQTTNVKQLFIRVVDAPEDNNGRGKRRLMLAMDVQREQWGQRQTNLLGKLPADLSDADRKSLHLAVTPWWGYKFD